MPIQLATPLIKDFTLTESDEALGNTGEPTIVTIRQVTQGDQERRRTLFEEFERSFKDNEMVIRQRISLDQVRRTEVMLTLAACNILDEKGKELFIFENGKIKSETAFMIAWAKLPPVIAEEIIRCVHEMNPQWSTEGEVLSETL